jgi:hypothetical protein
MCTTKYQKMSFFFFRKLQKVVESNNKKKTYKESKWKKERDRER